MYNYNVFATVLYKDIYSSSTLGHLFSFHRDYPPVV